MPLKLNLNIPNKAIYAFVAVVVVSVAIAGSYALQVDPAGPIPNPGHGLDTVQGYFQGDTSLRDSLGSFCQEDGTNCTAVGDNLGNHTATQNLSAGTNRIIDLSNPINNLDGANKQYVDAQMLAAAGLTCISKKCGTYIGNIGWNQGQALLPSCIPPGCSGGWSDAGTGCTTTGVAPMNGSTIAVVVGYCERWCCQ